MSLSAELLTPIAGDNPAGSDLRYDPVYDKIKEARREDLDVPAGDWETTRKTADWPLVVKLASEALTKRTKDLQIAVWLTEGLLRRDGFAGFRQGLELTRGLIDEFWETVYPELEDGDSEMRAAPLSWLGLKLDLGVKLAPITAAGYGFLSYFESQSIPTEQQAEEDYDGGVKAARNEAIEAGKTTPEQFEAAVAATNKEWYRTLVADIDGCLELLQGLEAKGDELFGSEAPTYRTVEGALEEVGRAARQFFNQKLLADPDPVDAIAPADMLVAEIMSSDGGAAPGGGAPSASGRGGGQSPTPASVEDAASRIAAAARYLRAQDPTNPAPYMLLRGYRWGEIRAGGGSLDPRLLSAPPTDVRVKLKTLFLDSRWPELLEAAEEVMAMPYGRGWLDLQRIALSACERLGTEYEAVAAGIRGSLSSLLEAIPDLPSLTLMDDSPTANAETLRWLTAEGLTGGDADPAEPRSVGVRAAPGREREPRDRALDLVRGGSPHKGIELLMQEAGRARSARARFLRRVEATGIMVDQGLEAVALPILRELAEQVEHFQLADWEAGDLVAEPLGLLYRCLGRVDDDPTVRQELYLRICRLDPIYAMTLTDGTATPAPEPGPSEPEEESGSGW